MKTELKKLHLTLLCGLICSLTFCQVKLPKTPTVTNFQVITPNLGLPNSNVPNINLPNTNFPTSQPNGMAVYEQDKRRFEHQQNELKQIYAELNADRINYDLPSYGNIESTTHYRKAFDQLSELDADSFSVKKATFIIENAYFEEKQNYEEFENVVKQTGDFLRAKMDELGYDQNRNLAKNFMLFQFFSDTLEIKSKNLKHLPFKYDF